MDSWSKYNGIMDPRRVGYAYEILRRSNEVEAMMKVVGEEGTSLDDYVVYQKGEFIDAVYFQQNSFDPIDAAVTPERQKVVFALLLKILASQLEFSDKDDARTWFSQLRQKFLDYNGAEWNGDDYQKLEKEIRDLLETKSEGIDPSAADLLSPDGENGDSAAVSSRDTDAGASGREG
jgi:V/A-type H+-transporting ATPase subunit A